MEIEKSIPVYIVIPWDIITHKDLSAHEKLLYGIITGLCRGPRKECFARNEYFVKLLHVSARHIRRSFERLEELGLIVVGFRGKYRYIKITWTGLGRTKMSS